MGYAETSAMIVRITPNSFPIVPRIRPDETRARFMWTVTARHSYLDYLASIGFSLKDKANSFGLISSDGDFLCLLAIGFVPSRDRVLTRWQVRKTEAAIPAGNGVVGILQHCEVAVHPRMDVALHRNELRLAEFFGKRRSPGRLRLIPLVIDFSQGMNVVRRLIVIDDFERLIHLEGKDVRNVLAAFLVEGCGLAGRSVVGSAGGDVNHNIFEAVVRSGDHSFSHNWGRVLLGAARFLRHVNGLGLCGSSFVSDFAADSAAAGPGVQQGRGKNQRGRRGH